MSTPMVSGLPIAWLIPIMPPAETSERAGAAPAEGNSETQRRESQRSFLKRAVQRRAVSIGLRFVTP